MPDPQNPQNEEIPIENLSTDDILAAVEIGKGGGPADIVDGQQQQQQQQQQAPNDQQQQQQQQAPAPDKKQDPAPPVEDPKSTDGDVPSELLGSDPDPSQKQPPDQQADPVGDQELDAVEGALTDQKQQAAFKSLRQQLVEAKKNAPTAEELETLRTQNQEMKSKLATVDLKSDPDFQQTYDEPIKSQWGQIIKAVGEFGKDAAFATKAFRMGFKERLSFLGDEMPEAGSIFASMFSDLDILAQKRVDALSSAEETAQQVRAQAQVEVPGKVDETADLMREKGHFMLKLVDGQTEWNTKVAQRIATAKELAQTIRSMPPEKIADIALRAVLAPEYQAYAIQLQGRIKGGQQQQQAQHQAGPGLGAQDQHQGPPKRGFQRTKEILDQGIGAEDVANKIAAGLGS